MPIDTRAQHQAGPRLALPFALMGTACVVSGGLLSAVTASAPSQHTAWISAYLVLVAGVAQVGLGVGQWLLARSRPSGGIVAAELVGWNLGSAAVIVGTLVDAVRLVDAGGVLLVLALVLVVHATRGSTSSWRWTRYAFRGLVVILLVSIPIGLVLARIGA